MRQYVEPYITADKILKLYKDSGKSRMMVSDIINSVNSSHSTVQHAIDILCEDGYLDDSEKFYAYYKITGKGVTLNFNGGYEELFIKENKEVEEQNIKKWYESENARIQFEDYPITKSNAKLAILLSGISVLIAILSMILSKCK